jgi:hypothetical protein
MQMAFMFFTIVTSAVMAGLVTYKLNEVKELKCFLGGKAEELYCAVESVDRELSRFFGSRCALVDAGRRHAESGHDALQNAGATLTSAKMLVGFYFPALSPALARTIAAVTTAHITLTLWEKAGSESEDLLVGLDRDIVALKDALESFKAAIIESGRSASAPAPLVPLWRPVRPAVAGRVLRVAA